MDAHRPQACNLPKQGFQEPEGWLPTLVHLALHSDPEFFINRSSTRQQPTTTPQVAHLDSRRVAYVTGAILSNTRNADFNILSYFNV